MTAHPQTSRTERWIAPLLFAGLTVFFFLCRKTNLTFDGSAFLSFFSDPLRVPFLAHLLFAKLFWLCIWVGGLAGLRAETAGYLQSAAFMAGAGALWFGLLRRRGIGLPAALLAVLLFATNQSVLENATSVELYGAATFAVTLSLLAFERASGAVNRTNTLALFFSCVLVLAMHIGFCFWVFAVYVALALGESSARRRAGWIVWGAATVPAILLWAWGAGAVGRSSFGSTGVFFHDFWKAHSVRDVVGLIFNAPLHGFARYAGLLLFAAPAGWRIARAAQAPFVRLAAVSTVAFFGYYAFWVVDLGTFYLPLQLAWGVIAAVGIDAAMRGPGGTKFGLMIALAAGYALVFLILPAHAELAAKPGLAVGLDAAYWVWLVGVFGWVVLQQGQRATNPGRDVGSGEPTYSRGLVLLGAVVALHGLAYGPYIVEEKWPDATTRSLRAFESVTPPEARLVTSMYEFRVKGQSLREALSTMENWWDEKLMEWRRKQLERWLQESVPPAGRPVYFDVETYAKREFFWGRLGGPGGIGIPFESFKFTQVRSGGDLFFRLDWAPPEEAAPEGLYPPENWGDTPVTWTRREAWLTVEPKGPRVGIKYYLNTPTASPERPVRVAAEIEGSGRRVETAHTKEGGYTQTLDLAGLTSPTLRVHLTVDPFWISTDGRELGVALYPPEWPK